MHIPEWSQVCAETARVFGNLSRRPEIRQCFLEEGEFSGAVQMLSTVEDRELSYACVGIMVNMMSDPTQRPTFKRHGKQKFFALSKNCETSKNCKSNYYYNWRCFFDLAHQVSKNGKWKATPKKLQVVALILELVLCWLILCFVCNLSLKIAHCIAEHSKILLLCAFWLKMESF